MWKSVAVIALLVASSGEEPRPTAQHSPPAQDASEHELSVDIERIAEAALERGVPGLSVALAFGDEITYADGWGHADAARGTPASADTSYRIGCFSGAFLACAVLGLVEDEKLELDGDLKQHFPELVFDDGKLTVAHLLGHTSGLPSYEDLLSASTTAEEGLTPERILSWLARMPLESPPGECRAYSDTNEYLLGLLVERVSETTVPEYLTQFVFERAGMADTEYIPDGPALRESGLTTHEFAGALIEHEAVPYPFDASQLCSTAGDLVRWMRALVERRLVQDRTFQRMTTAAATRHGPGGGYGWGLSLTNLNGEVSLSAGGGMGGYRSHVAHYPALDLTIAVLASSDDAPVASIERSIARTVLELPEPGIHDLSLSPELAQVYVGDYMFACNIYRVTFEAPRLTITPPTGSPYTLMFQGQHRFLRTDDVEVRLGFHVQDGAAHSFTLEERGVEIFAKRLQ